MNELEWTLEDELGVHLAKQIMHEHRVLSDLRQAVENLRLAIGSDEYHDIADKVGEIALSYLVPYLVDLEKDLENSDD